MRFNNDEAVLEGPAGFLRVQKDDEITVKLAMLYEGVCEGKKIADVVKKYGFSKSRYHQLRRDFQQRGSAALKSEKRGPKTNYRRTAEVVRQVVRYRFLDPDASAEVIAQKLRQCGWKISVRSVERVIQEHGLQKKTP